MFAIRSFASYVAVAFLSEFEGYMLIDLHMWKLRLYNESCALAIGTRRIFLKGVSPWRAWLRISKKAAVLINWL